ncbi:glycosyltransferase [soil metagenome]
MPLLSQPLPPARDSRAVPAPAGCAAECAADLPPRRRAPVTVALADSRWQGHHPTYLRQFAASLQRLGCRVLVLCRRPDEFQDCDPGTLRTELLDDIPRSVLFRGKENDPLVNLDRWRRLRRSLNRAEARSGWTADLIFFPYLDTYLRHQIVPGLPALLLGRPWSGLYFYNRHFRRGDARGFLRRGLDHLDRGDLNLRSANCKLIGSLDERYLQEISRYAGGVPTIQFPDITSTATRPHETPLSAEIRKRAAGRPVVGIIGLERRKGFLTLLRAALELGEGAGIFFCLAGKLCRETLHDDELAFALSFRAPHVHFDPEADSIDNDFHYNALFQTFTAVYGAYEGFDGSSNALTKAAAFRKVLIGTRNTCFGDRVERFGMGFTIDEGNLPQATDAIRAATAPDPLPAPRFDAYFAEHSTGALDRAFAATLRAASLA